MFFILIKMNFDFGHFHGMDYWNFFLPGFFIFGGLLGVLFLAFWVWMLVDCLKRNFKGKNEKIVWVLVIIFAKVLGALIYFVLIKSKDKK